MITHKSNKRNSFQSNTSQAHWVLALSSKPPPKQSWPNFYIALAMSTLTFSLWIPSGMPMGFLPAALIATGVISYVLADYYHKINWYRRRATDCLGLIFTLNIPSIISSISISVASKHFVFNSIGPPAEITIVLGVLFIVLIFMDYFSKNQPESNDVEIEYFPVSILVNIPVQFKFHSPSRTDCKIPVSQANNEI